MKTIKKVMKKSMLFLYGFAIMLMVFTENAVLVNATTSANTTTLETGDPDETIDTEDREDAYILIVEHMDSLRALYDLSAEAEARMDEVFYQANVYIANTDMTVAQLRSYVETVKANLTASIAGSSITVSSTKEFLYLCNDVSIINASYGETATLLLSVVNLGQESVSDVVITPMVSTMPEEWPFEIQTASDARIIESISAADTIEEASLLRQDVSWTFTVSSEAMTGIYPISFHAQYYRNGAIEETELKTYVNITGAPGNGSLIDNMESEGNVSTPRIIVTGFTTDPGEVYAGDTFNLTISVQNTSSKTAVSNIQFDLKAAQEGTGTENTYEAFLPTSGSATIYVERIAPGETTDISIEMSARSDLSQKPYVITVEADYEDEENNPYTATTNVSIPVQQEARVDTSEAEVLPESIPVGNSSNVMFSIYNMGKTTLYNVQVAFEGESISGGATFLGKIEPGATGSVDVMVDGIAPTMDDGMVTAVISYEDEAGNVSTLEKEIMIFVYEEYYDETFYPEDGYYEDPYMYEEEGTGGINIWMIAGIVVVVIGVVVTIIVVAVKKKKKKEALLKEMEDLED